ncbi:MAG: glycoside hydrolase [Paludibaculum sp.]
MKPGFEQQYARYLADVLTHFRSNPDVNERVEFQYISPINEPQWQWDGTSQEGTRASNGDIKAITRALAAELKDKRLSTRIALIESGSLPDMVRPNPEMSKQYGATYGNYVDEFLGDSGVASLLAPMFGYHAYGSDRLSGPIISDRIALAERMKKYPDRRLWQTEYCILVGPEGKRRKQARSVDDHRPRCGPHHPPGSGCRERLCLAVVDGDVAGRLQGWAHLYRLPEAW